MSITSIRQQMADYARFKLMGISTPRGENKLLGAVEDICTEIFNPGEEIITAINNHPMRGEMHFHNKPPEYWMKLQCGPGEWLFLPHSAYIFSVPSGHRAYKIIQNFGDQMFKGNKNPSRPEVGKINSFVKGIKST